MERRATMLSDRVEPETATVADLISTAVVRGPDATAVAAGDEALTFAELDMRANRLAHHLQVLGVGPDVRVGVYLQRSSELAVGLLAVLKAGGACVPVDPAYTSDRMTFMLNDAAVGCVLTSVELAGRLPLTDAPVVRVDADGHEWADRAATEPVRSIGPEHLAYVIYTSGSTGHAKGVMLTHGGLVNHHRAAVDLYELQPGDRVLQFCSIGFDASIEELFPTWAAGATVVFRPDDGPLLGPSWLEWLRRQRITVLNLPTAYWHEWCRDLEARGEQVPQDIRLVVVGGEKALGSTYRTWKRVSGRRSRWINVYGPTETTCMSTFHEPAGDEDAGDDTAERDGEREGEGEGDPPIGRPLPNTTVRVVDDALRPVPAGVTGELLIGGAGLARGYLNDALLTARRFIQHPDDGSAPVRMYRTGDLVRELPSGDLEFVGRADDQVKIRGFRVECDEVRAVLARHPEVAATVVVPRQIGSGETHLVAYVAGKHDATPTASELRRFLADRLPSYMVPAAFVVLDALPLNANGKVDREALPEPAPAIGVVRPRSSHEERLAAIWARVLRLDVERVGVDDDFFALGGHSLLAAQVIAQVREEFGTETPLRALFEAPTVAALAAVLDADGTSPTEGVRVVAHRRGPGATLPLSLAQEQMWALEAAASPPGLYNITVLHRFERPVDEVALERALRYLVDRHEILRTGFGVEGGRPHQRIAEAPSVELAVADLGAEADAEGELQRRIAEQDAAPFDLARPPLFRARLFRLHGAASRLALTVDHLICDGNAISLFLREWLEAYSAMAVGRTPTPDPPPLQFGDFALWQRSHMTDEVLRRQLDWWAQALAGHPLGPAVPFDHVPSTPTRRIASQTVTVPAATRRALDELGRATGSTLFVVVLTGVKALLGRAGDTTDVVVSTTLSGRNRAELEELIGMFSGIGRIRTDLSGDPPFTAVVARTREFVLGMFENQDIPFMRVRRAVLPEFPAGGVDLAAALPVEVGYFHTRDDDAELFFRGQLHPLSITMLDDGREISAQFSYKLDFYDPETIDRLARNLECIVEAVAANPSMRLSELPLTLRERRERR